MGTEKINLQLFNLEGAAPQGTPVNQGTPQGTPASQGPAPQGQPSYTPQAGPAPGPQGGGDNRPDGHVIRSVLSQAEQSWRQQNAHLFEIENILREQGYDPRQVAAEYRRASQQAQMQAQTGAVDPRLVQYLQGLEGQLGQFQQYIQTQQRREAYNQVVQAEQQNAELGKRFGINYDNQVRDRVRTYAAQNGLTVQAAFKELYFDQMLQAGSQQAQGQTLLNLQGRGQQGQPVSSAVGGGQPTGPIDWRTASREDYLKARERFRNGG